MTDQEHAERLARIVAERVAAGRQPFIQTEAVYRLLGACLDTAGAKR